MKVTVIGPGGVGGFLGCLLAQAGHEVTFFGRGPHLRAIRDHGLQLRSKQFGDLTAHARATDAASHLAPSDLVLLAVKMYDFACAAEAAAPALAPDGLAVTIQNGLDAPSLLAEAVPARQVLIGTASIEATILEPGVVGHLIPLHQVTISEYQGGPTPRLEQLTQTLEEAGINASVAPDGRLALWEKAASLIPFATLTAAADSGIGPLLALPETAALFQRLSQEAVAVALNAGHDPRPAMAALGAAIRQVAQAMPDFTSSLNRDFRRGHRTELEWLTGKLVRLAAEAGIPVPAHEALYAVLKLREQRAG